MQVEVKGTRLWFDVDGPALVPDGPALVCVGELDPAAQVAAAREIVGALPDGGARLEVIQRAGHFPWRDAPDRYWSLLTEFVTTTG